MILTRTGHEAELTGEGGREGERKGEIRKRDGRVGEPLAGPLGLVLHAMPPDFTAT